MTDEEQDELDRIYHAALQLEPGERSEFVQRACGENDALRAEIESLLAHQEQLGSFLENPAVEAVSTSIITEPLVGHTLRFRVAHSLRPHLRSPFRVSFSSF